MVPGGPAVSAPIAPASPPPTAPRAPFGQEHRADLICCTHTGIKWHRALAAGHLVNVGAIGRPENDGQTHVCYALLTAAPDPQVEYVPVAYDHEALAREMEAEGLPAEFVETIRTGWWTTCLETLPAKERARGKH
jgi:hypothetical protein